MATNNNQPPISSNSRNKLNSFRYHQEVSEDIPSKDGTKKAHGNKENQSSWLNGVVDEMQTSPDKREILEAPSDVPAVPFFQESLGPKSIKECPKTPGNRIPLADLISNAEDAFNPAPGPEVTPVDHVIWQHIPASSNPDASQTPGSRPKKRRHSSSSTGSPSHANSKKDQKEPLDLQSIQALFKTPQHDIAAELWNNYVDKNVLESSEELPPPRLANLLSSSPQTPGSGRTSRNSSAIRRSISCAAEWPTSRAKRRRVNRQAPGSGRGIFSRANSNVLDSGNSGKGKSSRINFLIDKIEKSLQPSRPADVAPPNSSPLRQHVDIERCRSSSPTLDRKGIGNPDVLQASVRAPTRESSGAAQLSALKESSSEFGDDDLDQDFMDLADAAEDPFVVPPASRNEFESLGSSGWSRLAAEKPQSSYTKHLPSASQKPPSVHKIMNDETNVEVSDEFDDDYGDFGENFEEILAECDKKQENPEQLAVNVEPAYVDPLVPQVSGRTSNQDEKPADTAFSEDEFDDDFDFDAIEQTMKQTGVDKTYVGRS